MPAAPLEDRRLNLHPAVLAFASSFFVIVFGGLVAIAVWRENYDILNRLWLQVAFAGAAIGIPSYLARRWGRSVRAGNIVCVVMTCLMYSCVGAGAIAAFSTRDQQSERQAAYDEFDQAVQDTQEDEFFDRALAGEDVSEEARDRLDRLAQAADNVARSGNTEDRALAVVAHAARRMSALVGPYNTAANAYIEAGTVDPSTLNSPESIGDRRALVADCIEQCEIFVRVYGNLEAEMRTGLRQETMSEADINKVLARWRDGARPQAVVELRQMEIDVYENHDNLLKLLHVQWGSWQLDTDGFMQFDTAAAGKQYDNIYDACVAAEEQYENRRIEVAQAIRQNRSPNQP